jgi:hypothetical protein
VAAVDYKYLRDRWAAYRPPAGKEKEVVHFIN